MNNDNDLNLHSMTKLSGWLRNWLMRISHYVILVCCCKRCFPNTIVQFNKNILQTLTLFLMSSLKCPLHGTIRDSQLSSTFINSHPRLTLDFMPQDCVTHYRLCRNVFAGLDKTCGRKIEDMGKDRTSIRPKIQYCPCGKIMI